MNLIDAILMPDTFTIHSILCKRCRREYNSRSRIIVKLKFLLHKFYCSSGGGNNMTFSPDESNP